MGFLKRLSSWFMPPQMQNNEREFWIHVRCKRCGEEIHARVDLWNELSLADSESSDESPANTTYTCRKVVMGNGRCFQLIEVRLTFNNTRKIQTRHIMGGEFIDK
jgi:hypothetical protein